MKLFIILFALLSSVANADSTVPDRLDPVTCSAMYILALSQQESSTGKYEQLIYLFDFGEIVRLHAIGLTDNDVQNGMAWYHMQVELRLRQLDSTIVLMNLIQCKQHAIQLHNMLYP